MVLGDAIGHCAPLVGSLLSKCAGTWKPNSFTHRVPGALYWQSLTGFQLARKIFKRLRLNIIVQASKGEFGAKDSKLIMVPGNISKHYKEDILLKAVVLGQFV